jgi:solute carrier family 15 (peptide/histidine transporter), member 3/4
VKQVDKMDRRVGAGHGFFTVPSASFSLFNIATMSLWSASYDKWIAPALRRFTSNPRGLTMKQRVGGGLLLATVSTAVSAAVEGARRRRSLRGVTVSAF